MEFKSKLMCQFSNKGIILLAQPENLYE